MFVRHVAWIPPSDDAWKLNFGGYIPQNGGGRSSGIGSVLRNENAIFKAAYAASLGNCQDLLVAELSALRQGLNVAIREGVDYIEIEGDQPLLMGMLSSQEVPQLLSTRCQALIVDCFRYLNSFRSAKVRQIPEYSNDVANILARMGSGLQEPSYWHGNPPREIVDALDADVIGRWIPVAP